MSKAQKSHTTQIRPSVKVDTSVILESIAKGKPLGFTLEQLLEESPTFQKKKEDLQKFKDS